MNTASTNINARTVRRTHFVNTASKKLNARTVRRTHSVNTIGGKDVARTVRRTHSVNTIGSKDVAEIVIQTYVCTTNVKPAAGNVSAPASVYTSGKRDSARTVHRTHFVNMINENINARTVHRTHFVNTIGARQIAKNVPNAICTCVRNPWQNRLETPQRIRGERSKARNNPLRVQKYTMNCWCLPFYNNWSSITESSRSFSKISSTTTILKWARNTIRQLLCAADVETTNGDRDFDLVRGRYTTRSGGKESRSPVYLGLEPIKRRR